MTTLDNLELLPDFPTVRTDRELLVSQCQLLEEILMAVKHLTAALGASSDSRSSVELKVSSARKEPDPTVKIYAGSDVDGLVDTALETFGRLKRESDARSMNGWQETVAALTGTAT